MHVSLTIILLLIASNSQAQDREFTIRANCDIPSPVLHSLAKKTQSECQTACRADSSCQAFVHISGWERCNLIGKHKNPATITFISAEKDAAGQLQAAQKNKDHSGKDLRKVDSQSWEACVQACNQDAACRAITYIEGYRACWLKASGGKLRDKTFSCGLAFK